MRDNTSEQADREAVMEEVRKCSCDNGIKKCNECDGSGMKKAEWEYVIDDLLQGHHLYAATHRLEKHEEYFERKAEDLRNYIKSLYHENQKLQRKVEEAKIVWAVRCSNYEPMEIDSFWSSKEGAEKRCGELGKDGMWRLCKIAIQT